MLIKKVERGFTIIEILIGIGLFGVIMPSIILATVTVSQLNDRASDLTKANIIAEEKMESLRNQGYNSLNNGTYDFSSELEPTFTEPRNAEYVVSSPTAGIKTVQVNISYTASGSLKSLSYKTIISELGVAQ